jgi:hypothetical protein
MNWNASPLDAPIIVDDPPFHCRSCGSPTFLGCIVCGYQFCALHLQVIGTEVVRAREGSLSRTTWRWCGCNGSARRDPNVVDEPTTPSPEPT